MLFVFDDNTYFKLEKCPIQDRFHLKDFDIDSSSKHESTTDYLSSSDVDYKKKRECGSSFKLIMTIHTEEFEEDSDFTYLDLLKPEHNTLPLEGHFKFGG